MWYIKVTIQKTTTSPDKEQGEHKLRQKAFIKETMFGKMTEKVCYTTNGTKITLHVGVEPGELMIIIIKNERRSVRINK